jgi:hypothetical protein
MHEPLGHVAGPSERFSVPVVTGSEGQPLNCWDATYYVIDCRRILRQFSCLLLTTTGMSEWVKTVRWFFASSQAVVSHPHQRVTQKLYSVTGMLSKVGDCRPSQAPACVSTGFIVSRFVSPSSLSSWLANWRRRNAEIGKRWHLQAKVDNFLLCINYSKIIKMVAASVH